MVDTYILYNPRISNYEPDELDYDAGTLSMINMTLEYENLQYVFGEAVTATDITEFTQGNGFYGRPLQSDSPNESVSNTTGNALSALPSNPAVGTLLNPVNSIYQPPAAYRAVNTGSSTGYFANAGLSFGSTYDAQNISASDLYRSLARPTNVNLPPAGYSVLNANQTGTAQYGNTVASQLRSPGFLGLDGLIGLALSDSPMIP
jgi:hypothetical protein